MAETKKTAKYFESLAAPGRYRDNGGLYLVIVGKSRTWQFRYKRRSVAHWMGLGPDSLVSLAQARDAAIDARRLLRDGTDPIEHKRAVAAAKAAEAEPARTFDDVAALLIASKKAGWKNEKHAAQWKATLDAYAAPVFGKNPVDKITVDAVLECLTTRVRGHFEGDAQKYRDAGEMAEMTARDPVTRAAAALRARGVSAGTLDGIEREVAEAVAAALSSARAGAEPETASRLRGRIENVLDYAKTRGWRMGENPARWKGHLDLLLPARAAIARVEHHAALPWAELPAVMAKLAQAG